MIRPEGVEKIGPTKMDPKWIPPIKTVAKSREDAIQMDEQDAAVVRVYSDGSGKDGKIGAAALYQNSRVKSRVRMLL
jgi:hypothetical protein